MPAKKMAKKPASIAKKLGTAKKAAGKSKKVVSKKSKKLAKKAATRKAAGKSKKVVTKQSKKPVKKAAAKKAALASKKSLKKPAGKKKSLKKKPVAAKRPQRQAAVPQFIDAGRLETEIYEPDPEVKGEFAEAAVLGDPTRRGLLDELRENSPAETPVVSGGDIDAAWDQSDVSGEETVGGSNPTPDQDIVDELGKAVGLTYQNNEPLDTEEKVSERDRHRWELEPESSEDYEERTEE
ncbi:MAG: hypothetical protein J2P41_07880 [Blastocatellia bacterium]|nr:hypothetical protein [Blastocatellia bacterium]